MNRFRPAGIRLQRSVYRDKLKSLYVILPKLYELVYYNAETVKQFIAEAMYYQT